MTDEYISREAAIQLCSDAQGKAGSKGELAAASKIWHGLKRIPAADVAPVVRCKDCKHLGKTRIQHYLSGKGAVSFCEKAGGFVKLDHFCGYGVRVDAKEDTK